MARIAHAGHDERLARRRAVRGIAVPEADQQIAAQSHAFPAQQEKQEIVPQQQRDHRCDEQIHVGEVAA